MLRNALIIGIVGPEHADKMVENPKSGYELRDLKLTLLGFYEKLLTQFIFRACGAAHHFPGVLDQNPDSCPWMRTNPGCSHSDTFVAREFFWILLVVKSLNKKLGNLIVDPNDLKEIETFFFSQYVMNPDGPDVGLYLYESERLRGLEENQRNQFSLAFLQEVERVKSLQNTKNDLFIIVCRFMADRIHEVLLLPDSFSDHTFPQYEQEVDKESDHEFGVRIRRIPACLANTGVDKVLARMCLPGRLTNPYGIFIDGVLSKK